MGGTTRVIVRMGRSAPEPGRVFRLEGSAAVVGRGGNSDLKVASKLVSREHLVLELRGGGWRVLDLASRNGVWLNGTRVRDAPVAAGDVIHLGPSGPDLIVVDVRPAAAAPARPEPTPEPRPTGARRRAVAYAVLLTAAVLVGGAAFGWPLLRDAREAPSAPRPAAPGPEDRSAEAIVRDSGSWRLLRVTTTGYSIAGHRRGDRLDVVRTTVWIPVRVDDRRSPETAAEEVRRAFESRSAGGDWRGWLDRTGRTLAIASVGVAPDRELPAGFAPDAVPAPSREEEPGGGPTW